MSIASNFPNNSMDNISTHIPKIEEIEDSNDFRITDIEQKALMHDEENNMQN